MRLEDALGLRINGKDAMEARLGGQVVWSAEEPGDWTIANMFSGGQDGAWLRSEPDYLFQDAAGTTPVTSDLDPVGRMADTGGITTYSPTQSSSAKRPVWRESRTILSFDGVDDFLDLGVGRVGGTGLFCGPAEQFFVAEAFRVQPGGQGTLIGRAGADAANRTFHIFFSDSNNATPGVRVRGLPTYTDWKLRDGETHVVWFNWDGTIATVGYDNNPGQQVSVGTAAEETSQRIILGARTNGEGFYFEERTGSCVIRDQAATPSEIQQVVDYFLQVHA